MNKHIIIAAIALLLCGCRKEQAPTVPPAQLSEITLTLKPGQWLYYNIKTSQTVGYSTIGNEADDQEWYGRSDWDIAFSEDAIKTNSGTSGHGKGGIRFQPTIPDTLELSDYEEYRYKFTDFKIDTLDIPVLNPLN